jgi:hypothetical protein
MHTHVLVRLTILRVCIRVRVCVSVYRCVCAHAHVCVCVTVMKRCVGVSTKYVFMREMHMCVRVWEREICVCECVRVIRMYMYVAGFSLLVSVFFYFIRMHWTWPRAPPCLSETLCVSVCVRI